MAKKRRRETNSLELPYDLIIDIISRVSEKDLMRFKCVSESWCSLINTDPYLSQLRSHRTALLGRPFLIIEKRDNGKSHYHYWLELDTIENGNPRPRQLHNPFDSPRRDMIVIGSCDGLLVLQQRSSLKMVVLNPITKKHHVVPPNPARGHNVVFIGLGYDHVHGCYKLVTKIKHPSRKDRAVELMIYNVNDRTWKKSRFEGLGDNWYPQFTRPGQCVDGALYWLVDMGYGSRNILCFVLAEEKFHAVDPPPYCGVMDDSVLTVFDGRRLCLVCEPCIGERVRFWLMECNYRRQLGSSYSWRWFTFLSIPYPKDLIPPFFRRPKLIPICFSACKSKVLFNSHYKQLFWYDMGKNKFDEVKSPVNKFSHHASIHVTSCVPNLGGSGIS